jgi:4-amino-4-deoxy-L-arabinose transferase-like glycosyltransferase
MRRNERLILAVILSIGVAFRVWGVDFRTPHHDAPFRLVPLLVSLGAGIVTTWLVFQLSARLFDRLTALTAAFLVATAYLHVRESHLAVAEVPLAALVLAALIAVTSALDKPARVIRWIAGGVLCAAALTVFVRGSLQPASGGHDLFFARSWWYHLRFSLWYGVGGPLLIASLAGAALLALTTWPKALAIGGSTASPPAEATPSSSDT